MNLFFRLPIHFSWKMVEPPEETICGGQIDRTSEKEVGQTTSEVGNTRRSVNTLVSGFQPSNRWTPG